MHKKLLIYKQKYCRLPVCKPYCYHEWGLSTLKRKNRPLCETPRSGYFCGPDKYLRLQEHTISEELFPVMEVDSYFVLVRSGSGSFIINGEEFPVQAGCVAWIQCSQVLTICPEFGETLTLWVAAFDYQLLSYYMFNQITNLREVEIVTGLPVIGPEGDDVRQIARQFEQFRHLSAKNSCGSAVIRSSFLRKIELLYNRAAARRKEQYSLLEMPLGRRASLYIATHSTAELTAASVAGFGRGLFPFKGFEAEHFCCHFFPIIVYSRYAQIISILIPCLEFSQNYVAVIVVAMEKKAVMYHFLMFRGQDHKISGGYGQVFSFIPKRMDCGIYMAQLLPFILEKFLLHGILYFFLLCFVRRYDGSRNMRSFLFFFFFQRHVFPVYTSPAQLFCGKGAIFRHRHLGTAILTVGNRILRRCPYRHGFLRNFRLFLLYQFSENRFFRFSFLFLGSLSFHPGQLRYCPGHRDFFDRKVGGA